MQTEELISYSKSHNYEIYEKYIDFGFSGSTIERPALTNLFEDAKAQRFDMVLVTKIDRFERSILDCLLNIKNLQEYGTICSYLSAYRYKFSNGKAHSQYYGSIRRLRKGNHKGKNGNRKKSSREKGSNLQ